MTENNKPTHIAYSVRNFDSRGQSQASWTRVGVAFAHKDGKGFDVNLESVPLSGRVVLRLNEPRPTPEPQPPPRARRGKGAAADAEPT